MTPEPAHAIAWGAVLVAAGLPVLPVAVRAARRLHPGRSVFFARWGFSHLGLALLAGLGGLLAWQAVLSALPEGSVPPDPWRGVFGALAAELAFVLAALHFARGLQPEGGRALGFPAGRTASAATAGLAAFALALPCVSGAALLGRGLFELSGAAPDTAMLAALADLAGGELWLSVALVVFAAPFVEELCFRGFLQPLLVQNLGDRGGIAATSLLFAVVHGPAAFGGVFALSLLLGAVMLRTQRIGAVWAVHAANNALTLAVLHGLPGGREYLVGS